MIVRKLLWLLGIGPSAEDKDIEIAVLGQQVAVIQRKVARVRYAPNDRAVLATLAKLLARDRWGAFQVILRPGVAPMSACEAGDQV